MKKLLLLPLIIIFLNSCVKQDTKYNPSNSVIGEYDIIKIDGCEYIVVHPGRSDNNITHKGNCKNHKQ